MATNTLIPYLPKLKDEAQANVALPHKLSEWDDAQGRIRMRHLADSIDVPPGMTGIHSIPNPWARAILFRRALLDANHCVHAEILGEWRGLLALLAFRETRRLQELASRKIELSAQTADPGSFCDAVIRVLPDNVDAIDPAASWAHFHLLTWNGERTAGKACAFAMTSPWTLVATGADYAEVLTSKEVPWFSDGILQDPSQHLSRNERTSLAEWMWKIDAALPTANGAKTREIGALLNEFAKELDPAVTGAMPRENVFSLNSLGLADVALFAQIDLPIRPAVRVLSDCALATDRPGAPLHVLIDPTVPLALGQPERDIAVYKTISMSGVNRDIQELQRSSSGTFPRDAQDPLVLWCTREFFFEKFLIYEQTRLSAGETDLEAFPGCRSIRSVEGSRSAGRHIVLPLRQKVLELFTPDYLERNLTVEWVGGGENAGAARFRLTLAVQTISPLTGSPVGGQKTVVIEHTYSTKEMIRVNRLPAVCLWPSFRFDDDDHGAAGQNGNDPGNRWALYYLFESWRELGDKKEEFLVAPIARQGASDKRLASMPVYGESGRQEGSEYFQVSTLSRFPEALVCTMPYGEQGPLGRGESSPSGLLLLKDKKLDHLFQGQKEVVGIDFGTTGSAIYRATGQSSQEDGNINRLAFQDHLLQITSLDSGEFRRITRDLFLPNSEPANGRILSIFQDFGANGNRAAVRDGHVLFMENDKKRKFVQGNPKSILTNLKWSEDVAVNKASQDFLEQLCLQSLAETISSGASSIELRYSYPTAFSDDDLNTFLGMWQGVRIKLARCTSVPIDFHAQIADNCESISAARFFSHPNNQLRLNAGRGAVSLDIGGGTTDIAVWNRDPDTGRPALLAHTSVKFAGQDIFLAPLRKKTELLAMIDDGGDISFAVGSLSGQLEHDSSAYCAEVDAIVSRYSDELLVKLPAFAQSKGVKDFLQIIELGLRGIAFYTGMLVGRLVKDNVYDAGLQRIPVFIGGNGSRLFQWCAQGPADNNSSIVRRFAQTLLAGANFGCGGQLSDKIVEVSLSDRPKEEVAFGLVMRPVQMARNDSYVTPVAGENYLVGMRQNRQQHPWNTAPDLQTLGTLPVLVDPQMEVFRTFLDCVGLRLSEDEIYNIASAVDQEIANMAEKARRTLDSRIGNNQAQDPVRKQPLFILALQHLLAGEIKNLVALQLGVAAK
jgi:hypothetical protein